MNFHIMSNITIELKKPYKAKSPEVTINQIRNILAEIGFFLKEEHYTHGNFFSCSLMLHDDDIGNIDIRTNGKGLSLKYAFASAYAELMERLQNNFLFDNLLYATPHYLKKLNGNFDSFKHKLNNKLELDFLYDPEEELKPVEQVITENFNVVSKLIGIDNQQQLLKFIIEDLGFNELYCVPFFNVEKGIVQKLPIELILKTSGSNGMCAGNTPQEAIIQGLCEIFERYAIKEIYYNSITPPSVDHEKFKGTRIYELIKKIEDEKGYIVIVKDCSLGIGLPVMGALVINPMDNTYNMTLGSDPWPITALERCLTEIYQNPIGIYFNEISLSDDIDIKKNVSNMDIFYLNYDKISRDGTGKWPNSIFSAESSYEFEELNLNLGRNDYDDLKHLINLAYKLKSSIFIRDVSFLGFNSYYVCTPGLSQVSKDTKHLLFFDKIASVSNIALDLENASDNEIDNLALALDNSYEGIKEYGTKFSQFLLYNDNPELSDLDIELVLCMLFFKTNNYKKAFKYISLFLKDKPRKNYQYYYCIKDYLFLKDNSKNGNEILEALSVIYRSDIIQEVISDFKEPAKIFQYHQLPTCFNCRECQVQNNCRYFTVLRFAKKIQKQQIKNRITYKEIQELCLKLA